MKRSNSELSRLEFPPDGDLILAGGSVVTGLHGSLTYHLVLAAIAPTGTADSSFGTSGIDVETSTSAALVAPGTAPLAVNAQGQILLGNGAGASGEEGGGGGDITLTVTEYNANGSINTSFGTSGVASVSDSSTTTGLILDIETNGQIVIGAGGVGTNFVLARFNSNGSLDTTFGSSGIETGAAETKGLTMITAANGETVMIGTPSTGSGIILQEFHTLANAQRLYVEQDADYNVTSITDTSGNVVERYEYDPYGTVTVLNPNGTVRGDGNAASSNYRWVYLHQGLRLDIITENYYDRNRIYMASFGRFLREDPAGVSGSGTNLYQFVLGDPIDGVDPTGESLMYPPLSNYDQDSQLALLEMHIEDLRAKLNIDSSNLSKVNTSISNLNGDQWLIHQTLNMLDIFLNFVFDNSPPCYKRTLEAMLESIENTDLQILNTKMILIAQLNTLKAPLLALVDEDDTAISKLLSQLLALAKQKGVKLVWK